MCNSGDILHTARKVTHQMGEPQFMKAQNKVFQSIFYKGTTFTNYKEACHVLPSNNCVIGNSWGVAPASIYPIAGGGGTRTNRCGRGDGGGSSTRSSGSGSGSGSRGGGGGGGG